MKRARIGARHDLAIMSCKGMSVTAARQLVDRTCARFKLPLFIAHDLDVAGFSIASTLHQTNRRYKYASISGEDFKVVDFGLRLTDVERLDLQSEPVSFGQRSKDAIRKRLEINGATKREIEFLLTGPPGFGQRVELNAMVAPVFVTWLEEKLAEHGVGKVVPDASDLEDAYRLFERSAQTRRAVNQALAALEREEIVPPADLKEWVHAFLADHPTLSWVEAVQARAEGGPP